MNGINILGTGRFVPEKVVTNNDFTSIVETTDEWISTRTGMKERHFANAGEPTWHMGASAAKSALEAAKTDAKDIDMILVTTVTSDYHTPSTACVIQLAIGAVNAFAFDINVACSGLAYAFDMARRYLADGDIRKILIVCAESLTQITDYEDRATCVLFGDGAGACVVERSDKRFASYIKSDASGAHLIYARKKRLTIPFVEEKDNLDAFASNDSGFVFMDGREVYKFATKAMPEAIENACGKLNIQPCDLDMIIPHQANYRIIETAAKNLKLPLDKIYMNIHNFGNTSSASIAIGLDECARDRKIKRGDLVCVVGFGAGLTYGASIFEY